ncbi:beta-1,3-glucan-binding protein-like [Fopius arisanus]|uniref:Beta-1,3-glucan-binding protein-like n=1 Tax=Fopius arisanus TaxID=64838 RepID=A0A9R1TAS9_9HYME|nr:PREDICTED: beta-1,3-glucan-binding protein-like [Fopius arisanus]
MLIKLFQFSLIILTVCESLGGFINNSDEVIRRKRCDKSVTVFNGKQAACKGDIIFEEDFEQKVSGNSRDDDWARQNNFILLNSSVWEREIKIPQQPDYQFCVYHKLEKNIKIDNGALKIIPTILEDEFGENVVYFGSLQLANCDGLPQECFRTAVSYNILPPIISARLTTKSTFNFRYGKIEIKAKFPKGDWLFPEIRLEGTNIRVTLGMARGNDNFYMKNGSGGDLSSRLLEFQVEEVIPNNTTSTKITKLKDFEFWSDKFHVYTTIWSEQGLIFEVDNERVGEVPRLNNQSDSLSKDLHLVLGLGVGGIQVFPDNTRSGNYEKPWRNVEAKAMLRFWQTKDQWLPTWHLSTKQTAALEIQYVKISAV